MSDNNTHERRVADAIAEMRAELGGMRTQVETIDARWAEWRKSTFSAFSLMAQRDAGDYKERQRRQKILNRALLALGIGLGIVAMLLILLIAIVGGYLAAGTRN